MWPIWELFMINRSDSANLTDIEFSSCERLLVLTLWHTQLLINNSFPLSRFLFNKFKKPIIFCYCNGRTQKHLSFQFNYRAIYSLFVSGTICQDLWVSANGMIDDQSANLHPLQRSIKTHILNSLNLVIA